MNHLVGLFVGVELADVDADEASTGNVAQGPDTPPASFSFVKLQNYASK